MSARLAGGRLAEARWSSSGELDAGWLGVRRLRADASRRGLRVASRRLGQSGLTAMRRKGFDAALKFLLRRGDPVLDRILTHPALDYWLFLLETHFAGPATAEDWELQFGQLGGFAASAAFLGGKSLRCDITLDPDGRFFLYATPFYVEFGGFARRAARLTIRGGRLSLEGKGFSTAVDLRACDVGRPLRRLSEVIPGIACDDKGWLQLHGVTMHPRATLDDSARAAFVAVLGRTMIEIRERDPLLAAEMQDLLQVVVPLENNEKFGSVSSSYVNLRGLIALSHSEDRLLQAETLIHEFCHMKMNQLLAADPVLLPGQSGQVFYSPWRADARRLRGLLLGAHAFLNVSRYLVRALDREEFSPERRGEIMTNVARRMYQVEAALQTLAEHGTYTEFGRRLLLALLRDLGVLRHATLWFPKELLTEQKTECVAHRDRHGLGETAFHKSAEFSDRIERPLFRQERPTGERTKKNR